MVRIGATGTDEPPARSPTGPRPLAGKVALVTGASRGIGEQIARVLHRDGATVVGVDVPQAAERPAVTLMKELGGDYLTLDITAKDAPQRIAHHLTEKHGGVDVVVHNAGITRDKRLANMAEDRWDSVIARQPHRARADHPRAARPEASINDNGRIVGVASIAGIAGNVGQTNYAASKAGVIGLVDSLRRRARRTASRSTPSRPASSRPQMTAAVPFATREVGRGSTR